MAQSDDFKQIKQIVATSDQEPKKHRQQYRRHEPFTQAKYRAYDRLLGLRRERYTLSQR
jgi:hypothetical protein